MEEWLKYYLRNRLDLCGLSKVNIEISIVEDDQYYNAYEASRLYVKLLYKEVSKDYSVSLKNLMFGTGYFKPDEMVDDFEKELSKVALKVFMEN